MGTSVPWSLKRWYWMCEGQFSWIIWHSTGNITVIPLHMVAAFDTLCCLFHRYNSLCDFFGLFIPTTLSCVKIMITVFLLYHARTYFPWILTKLFSCYVLPIFVKQGSFSLVTFKVPTLLMSTDFKMCRLWRIMKFVFVEHVTTNILQVWLVLLQFCVGICKLVDHVDELSCMYDERPDIFSARLLTEPIIFFAKINSFWWNVLLDRQRIFPVGKTWL